MLINFTTSYISESAFFVNLRIKSYTKLCIQRAGKGENRNAIKLQTMTTYVPYI